MFLTERQLAILTFIREYIADRGLSPTLDEMSQHFGVSKITIYEHVNALEKKGAVRKTPNRARAIELVEREAPPSAPRQLLVRGRVAAGAGVEAIDAPESFSLEDMAPESDGCYLLRIDGDSMIDAHICDGDLVVVKPARSASNGQIVVAMLPDESTGALKGTVKRFFKDRKGVRLQPENASMAPIIVRDVIIQGHVTGVLRTRL